MKREPQGLIPQKKLCQDGQIVKYVVFLSLLRVKLEWKSFVFYKSYSASIDAFEWGFVCLLSYLPSHQPKNKNPWIFE